MKPGAWPEEQQQEEAVQSAKEKVTQKYLQLLGVDGITRESMNKNCIKVILHLLCLQPGQHVCGLAASMPSKNQTSFYIGWVHCLNHVGNTELEFSPWETVRSSQSSFYGIQEKMLSGHGATNQQSCNCGVTYCQFNQLKVWLFLTVLCNSWSCRASRTWQLKSLCKVF